MSNFEKSVVGNDFFEQSHNSKLLLQKEKRRKEEEALKNDADYHWEKTSTGKSI